MPRPVVIVNVCVGSQRHGYWYSDAISPTRMVNSAERRTGCDDGGEGEPLQPEKAHRMAITISDRCIRTFCLAGALGHHTYSAASTSPIREPGE